MSPSEQPASSLAHARLSLAALALALFVGILIGGLVYHDPHLSTFATKTLFIVGVTLSVVCVLVGVTILAIYVFKIFDNFWWLVALFGAPLIGFTTYNTYTINNISQTVNNISQTEETKSPAKHPIKTSTPKPDPEPKQVPPSDTVPSPLPGSLPGVLPQSVTSPLPELSPRPTLTSTSNLPREEESSQPQPQAPSPEPEKGTDAEPPVVPGVLQKAETIALPAPVRSMCPSPARATPNGWVYVGTNLGRHWDEKHFDWAGYNKRLPEKTDILTAIGLVNLRVKSGQQAHIDGVICPGEKVQVVETKTLSEGYHWVKVKRIKEKEESS